MLCLKAAPERLALKARHEHNIVSACYLVSVLDPHARRVLVKDVIEALRPIEFDAIAFRGLSGALVAPIVAYELDKTLLAVRKGESNHSGHLVEGDYNARRYVIIDDIISSGDTVSAIHAAVAALVPGAKCVGVIRYLNSLNSQMFRTWEYIKANVLLTY